MDTDLHKNMEDKTTHSRTLQDVNVYITLDSSALGRMKAKQTKRKRKHRSHFTNAFSEGFEDLSPCVNFEFVISASGVLLFVEMILSITLIIVSATGYNLREAEAVGIIMNSISLLVCFIHLVIMGTCIFKLLPSPAVTFSLLMVKDILLLLLQISAFVVFCVCPWRIPLDAVCLTIVLLCVVVSSIIKNGMDYKSTEGEQPRQYQRNKNRKASYKRLRRN